MAKTTTAKESAKTKSGWSRLRGLTVGLLVGLGCLSLTAFMMVHWTEQQVLNTDNWVEMVGGLPKNPTVSSALGSYLAEQLFAAVDVKAKLSDALPPKAGFLVDPLADQLRTIANNVGTKFVASDQFSGIWVFANRTASTNLINLARGPAPSGKLQQKAADVQLKLQSVKSQLAAKFGNSEGDLFSQIPSAKSDSQLGAKLPLRINRLRTTVAWIDGLNKLLPYLFAACILGALAIAHRRRVTLLAASITVAVLSLMQLAGVRALQPQIVSLAHNSAYRPAIGVIYTTLVSSFNDIVYVALVVSVIVLILTILAGPYRWAQQLRSLVHLDRIGHSGFGRAVSRGRDWVAQYYNYIWTGGGTVLLLALAFWVTPSWTVLAQAILLLLSFMALVTLASGRNRKPFTA